MVTVTVLFTKAFRTACHHSSTKVKAPRIRNLPTAPSGYRMASTLPALSVFQAIASHDRKSTAIVHSDSGQSFSYGRLLRDVVAAKNHLSEVAGGSSSELRGQRIAFLVENSYSYVVTFLAILAQEAVALPLSSSFPASELRYILENSGAKLLLSTISLKKKAEEALEPALQQKPVSAMIGMQNDSLATDETVKVTDSPTGQGGAMLYTSGTTSRPKGVILGTQVITAQARSLIEAWKYTQDDLVLHLLPLHHIHGIINALFAPLLAGSAIEFIFPFNADLTWKRLAAPFLPASTSSSKKPVTLLTAVPTIYTRLLSSHASLERDVREAASKAVSPPHLRLNMSGSAALPAPTQSAWTKLTHGNVLLERYGMTEVGMALSCGLDPANRVDGSVGWPLPSVEARLVDVETKEVIADGEEVDRNGTHRQGEIQLRGPTVFSEYWRNLAATEAEFTEDSAGGGKWFKTGDIAVRRPVEGAGDNSSQQWARGPMYFIQGRQSVDIIKSGGEKVSALEVERELLSLPQISEAAVVGLPSDTWGQKITAVVVLDPAHADSNSSRRKWSALGMRRALRGRLANYKIPQAVKVVETLPRNAMGKVNKKLLVKELFADLDTQ